MNTTVTIYSLAGEAFDAFTTTERGEDTIVVLKDDAPEWVGDLAREAHGDFLPDDWRYASIRSALSYIHDNEPSDLDEAASEWADENVDIYTHNRLRWLASNLNRAGYCDEAQEDGLVSEDTGITDRIGVGQYVESREVWYAVQTALEDHLAGLQDEDED